VNQRRRKNFKRFGRHFNDRKRQILTLTENVKKEAKKAGFVAVGISNPEELRGLPYGKIDFLGVLKKPEQELPGVRSVMLMAIRAWDTAFNIVVDSTDLHFSKKYVPRVPLEGYQLYSQIGMSKAWKVANYLQKKGFESVPSGRIPLKTAAVKCGLGCQGKNTLLITPDYGPRVRLVSVLTTAELGADEPFRADLCKKCNKCVVACPAKAIAPYKLTIDKCMVFSSENPRSKHVPKETRALEKKFTKRPTPYSLLECSICLEACPIGKAVSE
jgi:epoxyqueuosine reductase